MIAVLGDVANREGLMLVEKGRGVSPLGLFDIFPVYDWPASRDRRPTIEESAALTEAIDQGGRSAFFVSHHVQLDQHPIWQKVVANCTLVTEGLVTLETLGPTLKYLEATTDLPIDPGMAFAPALLERFEETVGRQGQLLSVMLNIFDELMLASLDAKGGASLPQALEHDRTGQASRLRCLRTLLADCDAADVPALISGFATFYWRDRRSQLDVLRELYRITETLLFQHGSRKVRTRRQFRAPIQEQVIVIWAAMLLGWEGRLVKEPSDAVLSYRRTPDRQLTYIDSMARDFLALARNATDSGELSRFVLRLGASLPSLDQPFSDPLLGSRRRMLGELKTVLTRRFLRQHPLWHRFDNWVTNALLTEELEVLEESSASIVGGAPEAQSGIDVRPTAFAEFIGRKGTIETLRRRALDPKKTTGMILYGPQGSGKRTLGRVLAKALLCNAVTPDGDACDVCEECRAFSKNGSAGYVEADARKLDVATARLIASRVGQASIAERSVILIVNADCADPTAIDALLKSIETGDQRTIFVLTASRLKDVRMALQSRCERRRVHRLNPDETQRYLQEITADSRVTCEQTVLDIVAVLGQGTPAVLNELWHTLSRDEHATLASAVQALGLSSASDLAEAISNISAPVSEAASNKRLELIRALLIEIYLHENGATSDWKRDLAALCHVNADELSDCRSNLNRVAQTAKMTSRQFWRKAAAEYL